MADDGNEIQAEQSQSNLTPIESIIQNIQSKYGQKANNTDDKNEEIEVFVENVLIDDLLGDSNVKLNIITTDYPEMNEDEKHRLKQDIIDRGQIHSPFLAIVSDSKLEIFDGRNRYNLLKEMHDKYNGINSETKDENDYSYLKDMEVSINVYVTVDDGVYREPEIGEIKLIADSYNLSRRHLTATQKAIIAFSDRFEEQRRDLKRKSEEAQVTNSNRKNKNKKINESREVFNETLSKVVGTNREYISKWKRVNDLIKNNYPEKYRELSEIAYRDNDNFQEIVYLLKFKDKKNPNEKTEEGIKKIIELCDKYIEEKKKNQNLPFGNNEKERRSHIDDIKKSLDIPVPEVSKTPKTDKKPDRKDLWVLVNNNTLGKTTMERVASAIQYVLKTDGIDIDFKCYFAKSSDTDLKLSENKELKIKNKNFGEVLEVKSNEVHKFVYEDD